MNSYRTINFYFDKREVKHAVGIFRAAVEVLARKDEPTGERCAYLEATANEIEHSGGLTINVVEINAHLKAFESLQSVREHYIVSQIISELKK